MVSGVVNTFGSNPAGPSVTCSAGATVFAQTQAGTNGQYSLQLPKGTTCELAASWKQSDCVEYHYVHEVEDNGTGTRHLQNVQNDMPSENFFGGIMLLLGVYDAGTGWLPLGGVPITFQMNGPTYTLTSVPQFSSYADCAGAPMAYNVSAVLRTGSDPVTICAPSGFSAFDNPSSNCVVKPYFFQITAPNPLNGFRKN